jgi:hypothetical protein
LFLFYREEKECKENAEKKLKESKDTVPPTHRSQHICDSTNAVGENNSCDDVQHDIARGDVHPDITHGDV